LEHHVRRLRAENSAKHNFGVRGST
jgi:hypothetical protein